ncbi:hypothetical protein BO94DRAFT_557654 [Aspergillus sclerotioniger CBS 115572]|uniref:Uncharacterized protein n=1 Tax=Aspergillus sclerotioniger CBS 115572 TaxID=1450535 RepID=A0A317WF11_9EURO|nr:hypothetical protein BO94DRAFT_557654 [Aspergillus sclerotioniger CBS 115572]PWY83812.1 hypothetical protein BO94DRAFT_557654 [Aspergillus sclerotioniger CBS 115572]
MSLIAEPPAHRHVRWRLTNLAREIKSLQLDEFDVQQLDFRYPYEKLPQKPTYFASYPGHSIPEPNTDNFREPYKGLDDETEYSLTHISVGDSAFNNSGLYKHNQPEFGCYHITEMIDPAYPHIKALMYNNMVATDSTILCGELMPILRTMLTQLRRQKFIHQLVTPVLMFSLMGFQARVIEAFFRDDKLVLRPTKLFDFTHGNDNAFKTLALWYMGNPLEITTQGS